MARIESLSGIVSPGAPSPQLLLGVFPFITRKLFDMVRSRKINARWKKPKTFDRNLIDFGGGSAGPVTACIAAAIKVKVTLVEMAPRLLMREDPQVAELVTRRLRDEDIQVLVEYKAERVEIENGEKQLVAMHQGQEVPMAFDSLLLVAVVRPHDPMRRGRMSASLHVRHHSLFVPGDFDRSPCCAVIKPMLAARFKQRALSWRDDGHPVAA